MPVYLFQKEADKNRLELHGEKENADIPLKSPCSQLFPAYFGQGFSKGGVSCG